MLLVSRTRRRGSVAVSATSLRLVVRFVERRSRFGGSRTPWIGEGCARERVGQQAPRRKINVPEAVKGGVGEWWPVVDENVLESLLDISLAVVGRNGVAVLG
jgi:hypothetical protein